jgi:transcriptional regulator with XRE-family HTH domain
MIKVQRMRRTVNHVLARRQRATLPPGMRPDKIRKLVGARARVLRKEQGLTGSAAGNLLGKSRGWVSNFELGNFNSTLETLSLFAELLGVDEVDLFTLPELNIRHVVIDLTRDAPDDDLIEMRDFLMKSRERRRNKEEEKQRRLEARGGKTG